ncbi:T9SS type A sorting domain-containing protein [bacterium SCSIO 12741]|nr:T9SS type A sorting domain-containing protein [bacterium SCSIO 12741]
MARWTLLVFLLSAFSGWSQSRYWVASSTGNWNDVSNWSTSSGGAAGASVPGAGNTAIFNGNGTGKCVLDIAPTVGGLTVSGYGDTLDVNGNTFSITGAIDFTDGVMVDGSTGGSCSINSTGTTYFRGTQFDVPVTCVTARMYLNGSTFNGKADLTHNGASSAHGNGGNVFNDSTWIRNTGTSYLLSANVSPDTFRTALEINNSGSNRIHMTYAAAGSYFDCNVTLNNTGTDRITIGSNNGTATLTAGNQFLIGSGGYAANYLDLRNVTQLGATAQSITLTGTARLDMRGNTWNGDFTCVAPVVYTQTSRYNGTLTITQNGTVNSSSSGGNFVVGNTILNCTGSGYLMMGNGTADTFSLNVTANNTGSYRFYMAQNGVGHYIGGDLVVNSSGSGTDGNIYISNASTASLSISGKCRINQTSTATSSTIYLAEQGDLTIGDSLVIVNNGTGTTSQVAVANGTASAVVLNGATAITNQGAITTSRIYMGNNGDMTFNGNLTITNSATSTNSEIYLHNGTASANQYQENILLSSSGAGCDGIFFGNSGGSATLAAGKTITVGAAYSAGNLLLRNITQSGTTAQSITITGTGYLNSYNNNWGGNISFTAPRMYSRGSRYAGTLYLEKTGATNDASVGGNIVLGNAELVNSGSGYFLMGNGTPDTFQLNLIMTNSGSHNLYLAYNSAGNYVGGTLTANNAPTGGSNSMYFGGVNGTGLTVQGKTTLNNTGSATTSSIYFGEQATIVVNDSLVINQAVTGTFANVVVANNSNSTVTVNGSARVRQTAGVNRSNLYLGNGGDLTITGTLYALNGASAATSDLYMADDSASTVTLGGNATIINNGSGTISRVYLGNTGDVVANGTLDLTNSTSATNSRFYCANNAYSTLTLNQNIQVSCTHANAQGFYFGNSAGTTNLASGRTLTIGTSFIAGDLFLRNFNQTGPTPHALTITGTGYIYNYNSNWGGNVTFIAPRMITRGTTYSGTAYLEKNGATDDNSAGGNTFTGNATLVNSGSGYVRMGDGSPDVFSGHLTIENTASDHFVLGQNSTGNTVAGNLTLTSSTSGTSAHSYISNSTTSGVSISGKTYVTNTSTAATGNVYIGATGDLTLGDSLIVTNAPTGASGTVYIGNSSTSQVTINGPLTVTNSGAGTTKRCYVGYWGDVTINGNTTVSSSASATNSHMIFGDEDSSHTTFNGNLVISNTDASGDGYHFGNNGGSATLANGFTVSVGTSFIGGNLIFRNFTQVGGTPQSMTITGTGYIYFYDSQWGGNISFTGPRILARGSTFSGTSYLEKTGASDDYSVGGNTFTGNAELVNSGSRVMAMGNGSPDVFSANLTMNNTGSNHLHVAYNSAGNTVAGNVIANNATSGSGGHLYLSNGGNSTLAITGKTYLTNTSTAASGHLYLGGTGDVTLGDSLIVVHNPSGASGVFYMAASHGSIITANGPVTVTNSGAGTTKTSYLGNWGDITFNDNVHLTNTATANTAVIYCNNEDSSNNQYNGNIEVSSTDASSDGIYFGNSGGRSTLAAGQTVTVGTSFIGGSLIFRRFTQVGPTPQAATITGTGYLYNDYSNWGGNVTFVGPRIITRGTTYSGTAYLEKTGGSDDSSPGDNTFTGNAELRNSGSGRIYLGNGTRDTYTADVTLTNSGTSSIYFAHNSAGNTVGGNVIVSQSNTGSGVTVLSSASASTLAITGKCVVSNTGSGVTSNIYVGDGGDVTIGDSLVVTNNATSTTADVYIGDDATSSVNISGHSQFTNTGGGTNHRFYVGANGDLVFTGNLTMTNNSTATNNQFYCNNSSNSSNNYNGNIVVSSTNAASDGIYFGNSGGTGTLAATRTISVGSSFIAGYLYFRDFNQVGATAQTLAITGGTGYIYNYNSSWGGDVNFSGPRHVTRGTTYHGTATLEKNGASDDPSVGGNTFMGDVVLTSSGSGYFLMGNGSPDAFTGNVTMNNSGSYRMYLAHNSAGNTIGGNLIINNSASGSSPYVYISTASASTLAITGKLVVNNTSTAAAANVYIGDAGDITVGDSLLYNGNATGTSSSVYLGNQSNSQITIGGFARFTVNGAGTTYRTYLGSSGDVIFNGDLEIVNANSSSNSEFYLNYGSSSSNSYNGNIQVSSTHASCDGVYFGAGGGSGTLANGRTITIGSGFIGGNLYLRNFTQVGGTPQALTITGTGYIYNYDSQWGGNVTFIGPRMITRGTTYSGTSYLEKNGATNDQSVGGNTFTGNAELVNSGSGYFLMGSGSSDAFGANLILTNTGSYRMYLAYNSAGNTVAGNLTVNNSPSGSTPYVYLTDINASTLAVTGKLIVNNAGSATNANIYVGNNGSVTVGDSLVLDNNSTGNNSQIYVANGVNSSVTVTGATAVTNRGSGTSYRVYLGSNGDVTFNGPVTLTNSSTANNSEIYCNYNANSNNQYNQDVTVASTIAGSDGIYFGRNGGTSTMAAGRTVIVGSFVSGDLYYRNFTQNGNAAHTANITAGTGYVYNYNSNWGGNVTASAPRVYCRESTFNGTSSFTKNGSGNDDMYGGNVFQGDVTFTNNGTSRMILANNAADDYNGDANYIKTGSSRIYPAYNTVCTHAGDINFNSDIAITFGNANGRVVFDGTGAQSINDLGASPTSIFRRITLDNSADDVTLNVPISVTVDLTFTNGNIISDAANLITFYDNSVASGASNNSHVDGPVAKVGNDAFAFPVGDNGMYRPLSISAPSSGSANFQAQFISDNPRVAVGNTLTAPIDHVSQMEYWTLDRNASTNAVSVTLSWGTGSGDVTNLGDLVVSHYTGGSWTSEGNGGTTGNTTAGTITSSGTISSFSPFSLGSITSENPLPVELVSFEAIPNKEDNVVDLVWITASEVNNDYFTVERTQDLDWFETVVEVAGAGTTNERQEYHEVDPKPLEGISYYRLKQTDFDGKETKFDLRKVAFNPEIDIDIQLYPNPNDGMNLYLQIPNNNEEELNVLISDFLGKEYLLDFSVYNHGTHSVITMELNKVLAPGSYFVNIEVGGKVYTHKLIVQ